MIKHGEVEFQGRTIELTMITCDGCGRRNFLGRDPYCCTEFEKSLSGERDLCPRCVQKELEKLWSEQIEWPESGA